MHITIYFVHAFGTKIEKDTIHMKAYSFDFLFTFAKYMKCVKNA